MQQIYLQNHVNDCKIRASLDLLNFYILFRTKHSETVSFATIFIRLADRILYHSSKLWSQFFENLNIPADLLRDFPDDALVSTQDISSKYEIEAYLAAVKTLFEENLIGINEPKKQNLLGKSFAKHPSILASLKQLFDAEKNTFFNAANQIRNHSYHVNSGLKDRGVVALLKKVGAEYAVTIPNVYINNNGNPIDLAEIFISTHKSIEILISQSRDRLLDFFFDQNGPPSNRSFQNIRSPYGNLMVGLVPIGFEFNGFHGTKKEVSQFRVN